MQHLQMITGWQAEQEIAHIHGWDFSHIEGRYTDRLVILTPAAVRTDKQRQHISRDLIEYGLRKAAEMGFTAALVEGNPRNYHSRGFKTSKPYGIVAHESVGLPHEDCMMVTELVPGGLDGMHGEVEYASTYETLR